MLILIEWIEIEQCNYCLIQITRFLITTKRISIETRKIFLTIETILNQVVL